MLRCPPLTHKRIAWEKKEPTVPPAVILGRFLQVSQRESIAYGHVVSQSLIAPQEDEGTKDLMR